MVYIRKNDEGLGTPEMVLVNLETGKEVVLVRGMITEITVAPTGNAISYSHSTSHFNQTLYILQLTEFQEDGLPQTIGKPRPLLNGQGLWHVHNGGWSPNGKKIIYSRDADHADIYVIPKPQTP